MNGRFILYTVRRTCFVLLEIITYCIYVSPNFVRVLFLNHDHDRCCLLMIMLIECKILEDFSAAEESMREREERVRKAEEAARVMEGKAREERELCMELMASAKVGHGEKGQKVVLG